MGKAMRVLDLLGEGYMGYVEAQERKKAEERQAMMDAMLREEHKGQMGRQALLNKLTEFQLGTARTAEEQKQMGAGFRRFQEIGGQFGNYRPTPEEAAFWGVPEVPGVSTPLTPDSRSASQRLGRTMETLEAVMGESRGEVPVSTAIMPPPSVSRGAPPLPARTREGGIPSTITAPTAPPGKKIIQGTEGRFYEAVETQPTEREKFNLIEKQQTFNVKLQLVTMASGMPLTSEIANALATEFNDAYSPKIKLSGADLQAAHREVLLEQGLFGAHEGIAEMLAMYYVYGWDEWADDLVAKVNARVPGTITPAMLKQIKSQATKMMAKSLVRSAGGGGRGRDGRARQSGPAAPLPDDREPPRVLMEILGRYVSKDEFELTDEDKRFKAGLMEYTMDYYGIGVEDAPIGELAPVSVHGSTSAAGIPSGAEVQAFLDKK